MKKLTEEQKREILSSLTKIQQVAEDFQRVLFHNYEHFESELQQGVFYFHFSDEMVRSLKDIKMTLIESQKGGAQ